MKNKTTIQKVTALLKKYTKSRNDDNYLYRAFTHHFHRQFITKDKDGFPCLRFEDMGLITSKGSIVRARAYIQNKLELYLATNPKVISARRQKELVERVKYL